MNQTRNWMSLIRNVAASITFVIGIGQFFGPYSADRQQGAALLGLSYVIARGNPWGGANENGGAKSTAVLPLLVMLLALAALAGIEAIAASTAQIDDIQGDVSSIASTVSDIQSTLDR